MAQQRQNIYIGAPGFRGLNTQDAPVGQDASFASIAENAIIDNFGRIGAREGISLLTTNASPLGTSAGTEVVKEFTDRSGNVLVFSTGNNKIFTGTTTLSDITGGLTVTANNWKIVSFNGDAYFFQRGHDALKYTSSSSALAALSNHAPDANECLASFGRLWAADVVNNKYTLYWSSSLDGSNWNGGSSGSLDLTTVWPTGFDEVTALAEFNDLLVIFGKRSILLYSGASSPSSMVLQDTITNVGCVARDSVQSTGSDLVFLSNTGVMSLGRLIQEKSNPIGSVSKNVRDQLVDDLILETGNIKSIYSAENALYLLIFPVNNIIYAFDMRGKLEDGSNRVTTWPSTGAISATRAESDGTVYLGVAAGISKYGGYTDTAGNYTMKYYTQPLAFDDPSRVKMLKEINLTIIGGSGSLVVANWGYDYVQSYNRQAFEVSTAFIAEYGISEYNVATSEYSSGFVVGIQKLKTTGSGKVVTIGIDATISGKAVSIQERNTEAIIGRLI